MYHRTFYHFQFERFYQLTKVSLEFKRVGFRTFLSSQHFEIVKLHVEHQQHIANHNFVNCVKVDCWHFQKWRYVDILKLWFWSICYRENLTPVKYFCSDSATGLSHTQPPIFLGHISFEPYLCFERNPTPVSQTGLTITGKRGEIQGTASNIRDRNAFICFRKQKIL